MIEVRGLTKRFGGTVAVDDLTFEVRPGVVTGDASTTDVLAGSAGTLTALFLVILALPIALGNTGVTWLIAISDHLPGRAIVSLLVVDEIELAGSTVATVMIAWTAAALCAGGWSLVRRDAT